MAKKKRAGGFKVDLRLLNREARGVVVDVTKGAGISITPGVVNAVDDFLRIRFSAISNLANRPQYDMDDWKKHIRRVSEKVVDHLKDLNIRTLHTPRQLMRYAKPIVEQQTY